MTRKPRAKKPVREGKQTYVRTEDLPRRSLEDALPVAKVLREEYAERATTQQIATALDVTNLDSASFKYRLWAAQGYGLIAKTGDEFELSETGRKILAPTYAGEEREGKVKAILTPALLSRFFTLYDGKPLPSPEHFPNVVEQKLGVPRDRAPEAVAVIESNADFAGILEATSGDERPIVHIAGVAPSSPRKPDVGDEPDSEQDFIPTDISADGEWEQICFFITPLGDDDSEPRKHADMMLKNVVEPAAREHGLRVVRADGIMKAGIITQQVFENLAYARLCVADLSHANPNAFYELGVRHAFKLATVQVIRKGDKIPFDVSQGRTITIDTGDRYTITERLASAKRELSEYIKASLQETEPGEGNPVHAYLPRVKITIPTKTPKAPHAGDDQGEAGADDRVK